jgi:hypothetical protein
VFGVQLRSQVGWQQSRKSIVYRKGRCVPVTVVVGIVGIVWTVVSLTLGTGAGGFAFVRLVTINEQAAEQYKVDKRSAGKAALWLSIALIASGTLSLVALVWRG